MSNNFLIKINVVKSKGGQFQVRLACPYCRNVLKTYDSFRKHISRNHLGEDEDSLNQIKMQAAKLWRLYNGVKN